MKSSRQAALAAAALLAAVAAAPAIVKADDQPPPGKQGDDRHKQGDHGGKNDNGGDHRSHDESRGRFNPQQGGGGGGDRGDRGEKHKQPAFGQMPPPNSGGENPNTFGKPHDVRPPKPPITNNVVPQVPPQNGGQRSFDKAFGTQDEHKTQHKQFGNDHIQGKPPATNNAVVPQAPPPNGGQRAFDKAFGTPNQQNNQHKQFGQDRFQGQPPPNGNPTTTNFAPLDKPLPPAEAKRRFEELRSQRKEVKIDGGKGVVIEEPGKRRIFRENNRVIITHDDNERLRRVAPNARFERGNGGTNIAVIDRPGGYRIYSETDANGQLLRRYRRGPDGRDVIIIDNRRRRHDNFGRDLAAGIGIGVGVVAGAAILNSILDVPPPRVTIPRDEYIVDYERASDEDVYDALSAPPVEDFRDRYTLDEIRATVTLRDRMRRVDLDDITFDFGSWEVNPDEYGKLDRIARAMRRIISRNPNEVFLIEGYTDAVGSPEDNLSLSDRRAEAVAEVLTEQFQVPFENLTTQGYGEEYLKIPTQAPERLNRRVAVRRITPLLARGEPPTSDRRQQDYDDRRGPPPDDGGRNDGSPDDSGRDDGGRD
jgi:outer membrane protein OmpA-like peptidoglycan-associated protein